MTSGVAEDSADGLLDPVLGPINSDDFINLPRGGLSRPSTKEYNELMQSFSGLAADLSRIPHMCEIWLGMVQCAKDIVHETP